MRLLVTGGCGFIGSNFINYYFTANPEKFLIAKTIIGTPIIPFGSVTAFLTVATLD